MSDSVPIQDLTCSHCGSPLKTTDKPGTTITCNCCGSAFLIPESPAQSYVVNAGIQITNATILGDVVGGNKIVANGNIVQVGEGATVVIVKKDDTDQSETTQ